jgi:regulator of sirC expression with transglutaminase-like and TPR domain
MNLDAALAELSRDPAAPLDLAEIALQLARDEYPNLDVEAVLHELAGMAHEARRYMRGGRPKQVDGLCRYLFHDMGFHGNRRDYYDPANSYINVVLERRTGIPIALAAVTIAVGTRAGLPMVGVGLPGHYIVKVTGAPAEILLDPFHGGRVLTPADCENLVRQVTGQEFEASALTLQATPLGLTVQRMLTNLRGIYLQRRDWPRSIRVLERLRQLNPQDVVLRRDLGVCLIHHDQPGPAIGHLQAYLNGAPEADDLDTVRDFLRGAWQRLSERN